MSEHPAPLRRRRRREGAAAPRSLAWPLALVVLVLGLVTTGVTANAERTAAEAADRDRLGRVAANRADALADAVADDVAVLEAVAAFQATNHLDAAAFAAFLDRLAVGTGNGVAYVSYVVVLQRTEIVAFEEARRAAGAGSYGVDLGQRDGRYHVVAFSGPTPGRTDGVDLGQVPELGLALDAAADFGRPVVTDPFVRIQDQNLPLVEQELSVALYVPVYRPGAATATVQQRRDALLGWAATAVPVHSLLAELGIDAATEWRIAVRDVDTGTDMAAVPAPAVAADRPRVTTEVDVLGQRWAVEAAATPAFVHASSGAVGVGVAGTLASLAVSALVLTLARQRGRLALITAKAMAEAATSGERFRAIVDHAPIGVVVVDRTGRVLEFNRQMSRMIGNPASPVLNLAECALAEDMPAWNADMASLLREGAESAAVERRLVRADGSTFWARVTAAPLRDRSGIVALIEDVTVERAAAAAAEELRSKQARFEALVRHSNDLIVVIAADRRILYASPAVAALIGVAPEVAVGTDALASVHPDDRADLEASIRRLAAGTGWPGPVRYRVVQPGGGVRWIEATGTNLLDDPDVGGIVANCRDVTAQVEADEALRRRAFTDPLTGLATRDVLLDRLTAALAERPPDATLAVLFVDLDRFKQVNDRFGHAAGDALLVEVSRALVDAVRPGDMVARHGGDEFVVLLEAVRGEREARAVAERVRVALHRPVVVQDGVVLEPGASVGVALADGSSTAEAMLRDADAALYRAKASGRDRIEVFDDELRRRALRRLDTELVLRQCLEDDALSLRFEPVADLVDGSVVGAEARVRLALPSGEVVPYGELLPVAQEAGLASDLASLALITACRTVKGWADAGRGVRWVGVDVSVGEVTHPTFISRLAGLLESTGVEAGMLRLELPVEVLSQGSSLTRRAIVAAKALGVGVVLDGVGAELRSLATLGGFEVDGLKLDLAALPDPVGDPVAAAVAASVGEVAAAAGLPVVVVGADDARQLEVVRALGFRFVQGAAVEPIATEEDLLAR